MFSQIFHHTLRDSVRVRARARVIGISVIVSHNETARSLDPCYSHSKKVQRVLCELEHHLWDIPLTMRAACSEEE